MASTGNQQRACCNDTLSSAIVCILNSACRQTRAGTQEVRHDTTVGLWQPLNDTDIHIMWSTHTQIYR